MSFFFFRENNPSQNGENTLSFNDIGKLWLSTRVVNLGTTTKLCLRNFVPKPHPGHVVVVSMPKIG